MPPGLRVSTRLDPPVRISDVWLVRTFIVVSLMALLAGLVTIWLIRRWADRAAVRAVHRFGAHVNRFKLTRKRYIRDALLANSEIAAAVERHAREQRVDEAH